MRDFFIRSFERLIGAILILGALAVVVAAFAGAANATSGGQGILIFLVTLVAGALYLILVGGAMYLALGIYHNTLRTAEALERGGVRT
jgi:small-conductance mechanosensitive channel